MVETITQTSATKLSWTAHQISNRWPGREHQISRLVGLISKQGSSDPNLLIYGPASTGKTSIIRHVFQELQIPYVYASCAEFSKPRQLLLTILNQLKGKKRKRSEGFASEHKNEQVAEFLAQLPKAAAGGAARHIIVDHAQRLADEDVLAMLLRIRELTGADLSLVLLSRVSWGTGPFEFDTLRAISPIQIPFPAYEPSFLARQEHCTGSKEFLMQILAVDPPKEVLAENGLETFKNFLRAEILPIFTRSTRRLEDVQALVSTLFPIYLRPVREGALEAGETAKLHSAFQPALLAAKAAFDSGAGWKGTLEGLAGSDPMRQGKAAAAELDFELPYYSKFLLLAAYICSRNKASLDRRIFDPTSRTGKRHGQMSHDKQVENAREASLKGPHSFPVERMLAIFWRLLAGEEEGAGGSAGLQSADIFMQTSSLVSLRLLAKVSADELDDVKYKCNLSESLATTISKNLGIKLNDYVLYA